MGHKADGGRIVAVESGQFLQSALEKQTEGRQNGEAGNNGRDGLGLL